MDIDLRIQNFVKERKMTENDVFSMEHELLNDTEFWGISESPKTIEQSFFYIAGIHDACSYIASKIKECEKDG